MALKISFGVGGAIRRVMAKARAVAIHLIFERTILLLTVMFCTAVAATLWHFSRLSSRLIELGALQGTSLYSESLTEMNTFYDSEVVDRVEPHGVIISHDYATRDGAIPIPPTFTIEFGKRIAKKGSGMQIRLYSAYPFPLRKDGGPRDDFEQEALRQLRKQPDKPFFRFEDFQGRPSLRYATAVQMQAGCVACHNTHPESPKTDWKVGDVEGVQEIISPLDSAVTQTRASLQHTFVLLAAMGFLGLGGLGLVIGRMRRSSAELEQRARQQEALNAIAATTSRSLDLKELFEIALDKTVEVTGRSRVNIRLKDPLTGRVELIAHRGFSDGEIEELRRRTPHPMSEEVFASGNPLIINDTGENSSRDFLDRTRSVAWVPIKAGARVVGVLGISDNQSKPFSASEVELLEAIGSVIGVAIENARLFGETKRNLEGIRALHEIDMAINSTLDLKQVLDVLLEKIELFLPYSTATIRLLNKESSLLEPVACRNLDEKEWKKEEWKGGRGTPNIAFESKAPVMVGNVQTDPRVKDPEFFRKHGLVSYLGVPLIVQDEVLGVISFYTKEEHEFTKGEVEFLSTLAGQAAVAIHNSQLYQEMIKLAADLSRSNRVKDEFLSVMSHELRTPLNVVMGYTGMIRDGLLGEINPEQEKALEKVISRARDQLTMISSILQATQIEAEGVRVERHEVSLKDFLDDLRSSYSIPLGKELSVIWDYSLDLPVVHTDAEKLKHVLQNLINNAIKFTPRGHVTVSVTCLNRAVKGENGRRLAEAVEFKVADTGIGIAKEDLPFIFERFRQADSSETRRYGGVGIGLYIVKKYAELLGGKVEVASEPGKGSIFTVLIPVDGYRVAVGAPIKGRESLTGELQGSGI